MLNINNTNSPSLSKKQNIDVKEFLNNCVRYWKLFAYAFLIFTILGFLYLRYATKKYRVNASIQINEDKSSLSSNLLEELNYFDVSSSAENEIGILKSYSLIRSVVDSLSSNLKVIKIGSVKNKEAYGTDSPIKIVLKQNLNPLRGQIFRYYPIDSVSFRLETRKTFNSTQTLDTTFRYGQVVCMDGIFFQLFKRIDYINKDEDPEKFDLIFNDAQTETIEISELLQIVPLSMNSNVLKLTIETGTPNKYKDIIDVLLYKYIKRELLIKNETAQKTIDFINKQLLLVEDSLTDSELKLENFKVNNNGILLTEEARALYSEIKGLETEQTLIDFRIKYFNYLLDYLNKDFSEFAASPITAGIDDQALNALVYKLNDLNNQLVISNLNSSEKNPRIVSIRNQLSATIYAIKENIKNLKNTTDIKKSQNDINIRKALTQLNTLPGKEKQLINIKRRFDIKESLYLYLQQKRAEAGIALSSNVSDANIVDQAWVSNQIFPKGVWVYSFLILCIVLIPVLIVLVKTYWIETIQSVDEIRNATSIPVLASISFNTSKNEMILSSMAQSYVAENFRMLRSSLKYMLPQSGSSVILFSSYIAGEGKSFIAVNTAIIHALSNYKTILVDLDMRRPRLHKILSQPDSRGLSDLLIGDIDVQKAIKKTSVENLDFISAGNVPPNPSELLLKDTFVNLITHLRGQYDLIILDSPPIGLVSEALEINKLADLFVFVVRQDKTPKEAINAFNEYRNKAVVNPAIVFNGVKFRRLLLGTYEGNLLSDQYHKNYS